MWKHPFKKGVSDNGGKFCALDAMNRGYCNSCTCCRYPPERRDVGYRLGAVFFQARYAASSRAAATYRAYQSDWRIFAAWCEPYGLSALPAGAATLAIFLGAQATLGLAPATLTRRLAAIRLKNPAARLPSPHDTVEVLEVMRGIRRETAHYVTKKKAAVSSDLKRMVDMTDPDTFPGLRDRALLLLGFAGAFRRSELVAVDIEHLLERPEGLQIRIPKSKTNQEKRGKTIAVQRILETSYCLVQSLNTWLTAAGVSKGAVFVRIRKGHVTADRLAGQAVARTVKRYPTKAGFLESQYAGHSLRSGILTSAAEAKASIFKMQAQSRHKSLDVLSGYVQHADLFEDHAGDGLLGTPTKTDS
jgi:site-specific recombinase XerD